MNRLNKQGERMTNKMPVVGKRYRATEANEFIPNKDYIMSCDEILSDRIILDKDKRGGHIIFPIKDFFKYFEELPEDNEAPNPVDFKKEEVNEVERALEELKREINYLENKGIIDFEAYLKLRTRSQNLVDALEAEKTVMSKPEPKIDIKEEHVDPVSIWKDVSELPDDFKGDVIIKDRDGYVKNDWLQGASKPHFGKDFLKYKWCYLHDLINSFEQMQKDIEELKRK